MNRTSRIAAVLSLAVAASLAVTTPSTAAKKKVTKRVAVPRKKARPIFATTTAPTTTTTPTTAPTTAPTTTTTAPTTAPTTTPTTVPTTAPTSVPVATTIPATTSTTTTSTLAPTTTTIRPAFEDLPITVIINRGGGQGRVLPAANETFELSLVCGGVGFNAVLQVRNSTLTTGFLPDKVNCLATITRPPATPYESVGFSYNGVDGGQFLRVHDRHPLEIFFLFPLAKA